MNELELKQRFIVKKKKKRKYTQRDKLNKALDRI